MSSNRCLDLVKVLVLSAMVVFCALSAGATFFGSTYITSLTSSLKVDADLSPCNRYDPSRDATFDADHSQQKFDSCKSTLISAYDDANVRCQDYLRALKYCVTSIHYGCQNFNINAQGCINMIINDYMNEWRRKNGNLTVTGSIYYSYKKQAN